MAIVTASNLRVHYGGPLLLDGVSLKVEPGARIGLIGRNGSGKSTLLRILAGRQDPAEGSVSQQRGARIAFQSQELEYEEGETVFESMRSLFADAARRESELRELEHRIAETTDGDARERLLAEYQRLQHEQEHDRVYDVDRHIASMLQSLGLAESTWHQRLSEFSGGERNIIGLARVLLSQPDLMLLDEPSNHLDMDGVEWFIDLVRRSPSAVLMVSHNRHLLDATAREIWELRGQDIKAWTGNYTDFQRQKAEALALQERQYKTQQRLIQRLEFQARRLRDMANAYDDPGQAKRAKAMQRRVEKMEKVERPESQDPAFRAAFQGGGRHGRIALVVEDFHHAFGERVLFDGANLEIEYGNRVCLVGPNGSGKTTLLRQIREHGSWENPTLRLGKATRVGEYRQLHDVLDHDQTLEDWAQELTGLGRNDAAQLLYRFLFTREDLERRIGTLSGGEKSRLQLARLANDQVNFLMLDEPTNHLDIQSCEQLEDMLADYEGTLLVISHDRYFLDKLVNRVIEVRDKQLVDHRKTFAAWWTERPADQRRRTALEDRRAPVGADKDDARRAYADHKARRRELARLKTRYRSLETRITALEARQAELEERLENAYAPGRDPVLAQSIVDDLETAKRELSSLYTEWEEVASALGE